MTNMQANSPLQNASHKKPSLTPRELIMRHIKHPEIPITDEDIENLNLGYKGNSSKELYVPANAFRLSGKEKREADELADSLRKNGTGLSYKATL